MLHSTVHAPLSPRSFTSRSQDSSGWVADLRFSNGRERGAVFVFSHILWRAWFLQGWWVVGREMKEGPNEWRQPEWRMWFIKDTSWMNRA